MAEINVKQLSKAIKIDLDNLLAQMKAAGPVSYTHLTLPTNREV